MSVVCRQPDMINKLDTLNFVISWPASHVSVNVWYPNIGITSNCINHWHELFCNIENRGCAYCTVFHIFLKCVFLCTSLFGNHLRCVSSMHHLPSLSLSFICLLNIPLYFIFFASLMRYDEIITICHLLN